MRSWGVLLLSFGMVPAAQAASFAVIPQVGLAGYGAVMEWAADNTWSVSAGYTGARFNFETHTNDADYDGKVHLGNPQLMVNWSPFDGYFRVSAGTYFQDSEFNLTARRNAAGNLVLNGVNYPQGTIDSFTANALYSQSVVPALSLGWQTPQNRSGLGYSVNLGGIYTGRPKVTASATGPQANTPQGRTGVEYERQQLEKDLAKYRVLPILQAGLLFRF